MAPCILEAQIPCPTNRRIRLTSGTPHTARAPARGAWTTPVPETPPLPVRQPAPIAPPAAALAGEAPQAAQQQQQGSTSQQAEQIPPAQGSARHYSESTTTQFSSSRTGTAEVPAAADIPAAAASTEQTALPTLPQKRTHEATLATMPGSIEPPHHTWHLRASFTISSARRRQTSPAPRKNQMLNLQVLMPRTQHHG